MDKIIIVCYDAGCQITLDATGYFFFSGGQIISLPSTGDVITLPDTGVEYEVSHKDYDLEKLQVNIVVTPV